jgi:hypothetical protein
MGFQGQAYQMKAPSSSEARALKVRARLIRLHEVHGSGAPASGDAQQHRSSPTKITSAALASARRGGSVAPHP